MMPMPSILVWIFPNRVDRHIIAVTFLLFVAAAIAATGGNAGLNPVVPIALAYGFFGGLFAVPATLGTQSRSDIRKSIPLLLLALFSLGLIVILVTGDQLWSSNRISPFETPRQRLVNHNFLNYYGLPFIVAAYFGTLLVSVVFSRVMDRLLNLQWIQKQNRVRLLAYFVVFLFACSLGQRLLDSYPIHLTPRLLLIAGAVLLIPATYLLCRLRNWWMRCIVFMLFLLVILTAMFSMQSLFDGRKLSGDAAILAAPLSYFLVLMLLWQPVSTVQTSDVANRRWPSLWGLSAIGATILIAVAATLVDLVVALQFGGIEGLEIARFVRRLQHATGVNTQYQLEGNADSLTAGVPVHVIIDAEFSSNPGPDYFDSFAKFSKTMQLSLTLYNLGQNVDTSSIADMQKRYVSLETCRLSTQQFLDLIIGSQHSYVTDCQFENTDIGAKPFANQTGLQFVTLHQIPAGNVAVSINALQTAGFNGRLQLRSCPLNDDDWRALGGLQNSIVLYIQECPLPKSTATRQWLKEQLAQKSKETYFQDRGQSTEIWSFLDLNFNVYSYGLQFDSDGETWDALFLGGFKLQSASSFLEGFMNSENLNQDLVDFHLVFDSDKNPIAIRNVIIPVMNDAAIERTSALMDLEILSFDTDWVNESLRNPSASSYSLINLQPLGKLTRLKELYFPRNVYLDNFQVFAELPNLKILQFDAYHDMRLNNVPQFQAEHFPNLKQIRLFSQPHPKLLVELAKLKQLERVDIINSDEWFETAEEQEALKSVFDKRIEVRFLKASDYPDPPESFRKHLKQVKQDVRKRRIPVADEDLE